MSLKNRQERNRQLQEQQTTTGYGNLGTETRVKLPAQLIPGREYFSVVDGEIVNVVGTDDIPGMSLAWLCQSEEDGSVATISHKEAPLFTTIQRALQFQQDQQQRGGGMTKQRT